MEYKLTAYEITEIIRKMPYWFTLESQLQWVAENVNDAVIKKYEWRELAANDEIASLQHSLEKCS